MKGISHPAQVLFHSKDGHRLWSFQGYPLSKHSGHSWRREACFDRFLLSPSFTCPLQSAETHKLGHTHTKKTHSGTLFLSPSQSLSLPLVLSWFPPLCPFFYFIFWIILMSPLRIVKTYHEMCALTQLATNNLPKCVSRPSIPHQTRPKCPSMVSPLRGRQAFAVEGIHTYTHSHTRTQALRWGLLATVDWFKREACSVHFGEENWFALNRHGIFQRRW